MRQLVAELIGASSAPSIAVATDMGNRAVLHALETSWRALDDEPTSDHLKHLATGFGLLLGYRNFYVHSLTGVSWDISSTELNVKLHGHAIRLRGEGKLRATHQNVTTSEIRQFKNHCLSLSQYARAIMNVLVEDEWDLSSLLDLPPPSLEKPVWPASLQSTPHNLQE